MYPFGYTAFTVQAVLGMPFREQSFSCTHTPVIDFLAIHTLRAGMNAGGKGLTGALLGLAVLVGEGAMSEIGMLQQPSRLTRLNPSVIMGFHVRNTLREYSWETACDESTDVGCLAEARCNAREQVATGFFLQRNKP